MISSFSYWFYFHHNNAVLLVILNVMNVALRFTSFITELVNLEIFYEQNIWLVYRLQESQYSLKEGFKKVFVVCSVND